MTIEETPEEIQHAKEEEIFDVSIMIILAMLIIYMMFDAFKYEYGLTFGHQASLVTLIGFGISYAYQAAGQKEFAELMKFDDDLFFYFCLPPIVFARAFNMQRKKFFKNIRNILLLGLFSTIITFILFSVITWFYTASVGNKKMSQTDGATGVTTVLELSTHEIILMCSLLCCTDVFAAISLIKPDKKPKLYSLTFGEGITNDAVAIILFNAIVNYDSENSESEGDGFSAGSILDITVDFFFLGFRSILVGFFFAILVSLLLKKVRALTSKPQLECVMVFVVAYLSYVTAELLGLSGIISLLMSGIMMANYTWYNLSPQGKQSSGVIFRFLGCFAECFVFSQLGLTFFSYTSYQWSLDLIIVEFFVILIGRGLGTFGLFGLLKLCGYERESSKKITWKELTFIWYAGLIRGAIAFGLVLKIDSRHENRGVIVTTCLTLVVFTTVFFGSTVGLVAKCLFGNKSEADDEAEETKVMDLLQIEQDSSKSSQVREPLLHYNERLDQQQSTDEDKEELDIKKDKRERSCIDYILRFDTLILRPILVHKYHKNRDARAKEFYELFQDEDNQISKLYARGKRQSQKKQFSARTGSETQSILLKTAETMALKRRRSTQPDVKSSPKDIQKGSSQEVTKQRNTKED